MNKTQRFLNELETAAETAQQLRDEAEHKSPMMSVRLKFYAGMLGMLSRAARRELSDEVPTHA